MTTYIHVNQNKIKSNIKNKTLEPVITIKRNGSNVYCHEVQIHGPSKVIYSENGEPILSCGARVVIETDSVVTIIR